MNRFRPTGGVISAVSSSTIIRMPNQTGSKPMAITTGVMIGTVAIIIDSDSMNMPSTRYSATIIHMVCIGVRPLWVIRSVTCRPMPTDVTTKLRKVAAIRISMIITVVRMVPSSASASIAQVSRRFQAASAKAIRTPSAADSVGVARPV